MTLNPTIVSTGKQLRPSFWARLQGGLLALPLALVLLTFLAVPVGIVVAVSFWDYNDWEVIPDFVTFNYVELFTSRLTYILYAKTLKFAFLVWAFTLVIGVMVAYVLTFRIRSTKWQIVLFLVCTIPFWTSNIIRMIAWIPVLGRHGLVNGFLEQTGLIGSPIEWLLYSEFAVVLAFVHLYALFMVVPVCNSMARIDTSLLEAARDAGASGIQTFFMVILPLCRPGMAIGSIFVVALVMGDFVTVKMMSGGQAASVGVALRNEIALLQYPPASAAAVILLLFVLAMIYGLTRIVDIRKEL
jgi:putative spermidine/putrescine transport system permease protein